jgi:hypothetical protein
MPKKHQPLRLVTLLPLLAIPLFRKDERMLRDLAHLRKARSWLRKNALERVSMKLIRPSSVTRGLDPRVHLRRGMYYRVNPRIKSGDGNDDG